jgi:general stress protein CsbA
MRDEPSVVRLAWLPVVTTAVLVAPALSLALVLLVAGTAFNPGYWLVTVGVPALVAGATAFHYLRRLPLAVALGLVAATASLLVQGLAWTGVR